MRPKLTVNVHLRNGVPIDASLSAPSKEFLNKIASSISPEHHPVLTTESTTENGTTTPPGFEPAPSLADPVESSDVTQSEKLKDEEQDPVQSEPIPKVAPESVTPEAQTDDTFETIEVPLVFDGEFFDILLSDVNNLDVLQAEEEEKMKTEIVDLGKEVALVAKPSRFSKSDLTRWRNIFELYLDAEVFFATHENDHGSRSSQVALKKLKWFQDQVESRELATQFKLPESRAAFTRFMSLNASLLKNLQFQELNKLAVTKILKSELNIFSQATLC